MPGTILFFDDEQSTHDTYGYQLQKLGFTVLSALTVQQFFDLLKANPIPDLIITDVMSPWTTEDRQLLGDPDTHEGLTTGLTLISKLDPDLIKRVCVLSKRRLARLSPALEKLGVNRTNRIFSKIEYSAKEFAQVVATEILPQK